MLAALPPTVKDAIAVGHMSKGRVVKGIEQTWCRASKSAWRWKIRCYNVATPLQYSSAGDSPPTTLLYFTLAKPDSIIDARQRRINISTTSNCLKMLYSVLLLQARSITLRSMTKSTSTRCTWNKRRILL